LNEKQFTIIVPARLESQRLKRKLLLAETGKPLIVHTLENLAELKEFANIYTVTDSDEIAEAARPYCDKVFPSPVECQSGTERITNILEKISTAWVLNVQADEPEVAIDELKKLMMHCVEQNGNLKMATMGSKFQQLATFNNPNAVKVVVDKLGQALYFSRSPVPHGEKFDADRVYHHIGIYAYRKSFLKQWNSLPEGILEKIEKLEQLRALENCIPIFVMPISNAHKGIDTREDYEAFAEREISKINGK
jgi:3-deoxy-manno-octulosonate cytidylyltransferase (CMP-KDO synthetase)